MRDLVHELKNARAEIERLTNKLNTDSQNFQIECQKAEIERLTKERDERAEQVDIEQQRWDELNVQYRRLRALLAELAQWCQPDEHSPDEHRDIHRRVSEVLRPARVCTCPEPTAKAYKSWPAPPPCPVHRPTDEDVGKSLATCSQLATENERLRAALDDYGNHCDYCPAYLGGRAAQCLCGFREAMRAVHTESDTVESK